MWIFESILLSISLAMDAFAVSISDGLNEKNMKIRKMLLITITFGVFQGVMPLLGYLFASIFTEWIQVAIPIIGFCILSFLGGKMVFEAARDKGDEEEKEPKFLSLKVLFVQAIATSIDALTIGVVYVGHPAVEVYVTFAMIAVVTTVLCMGAVTIGKKFGNIFGNKAEIFGGIILIGIGLKTLITFLVGLWS